MTRWLILTQYYPPEVGAPQIRLRSFARELQRQGIGVEVLTGMPNYPAGKMYPGYVGRRRMREHVDGVPVTRTWTYAGTGKAVFLRLTNYLSFTLSSLVELARAPRPDVLFVESQPLSLGFSALLMKWFRSVPYIYNVPDLQVDAARELGFIRNRAALWLATRLEDLFLRQAWKVSTVTEAFIHHFEERGLPRGQITFLPNGADTEFLQPSPPCETLLDQWGLRGKKVFLYLGTHAFYHGLNTLIDAAALLRDRPDIVFLMVGDGPEKPRLVKAASSRCLGNVIFAEAAPYEEMRRLYSIAYASLAILRNVPVARRMRPAKIFPSLSCGVPVIYAGPGEAAELLERHHCGVPVPPEQPAALAAAIARLASAPEERDALGQRGRSFVEAEYGWSGIVTRWLAEVGHPVAS